MQDEVEERLINAVVYDAGDNTAVFDDHLVQAQRIARITLGVLGGSFNLNPAVDLAAAGGSPALLRHDRRSNAAFGSPGG